jgi:hypothetical protein
MNLSVTSLTSTSIAISFSASLGVSMQSRAHAAAVLLADDRVFQGKRETTIKLESQD